MIKFAANAQFRIANLVNDLVIVALGKVQKAATMRQHGSDARFTGYLPYRPDTTTHTTRHRWRRFMCWRSASLLRSLGSLLERGSTTDLGLFGKRGLRMSAARG